MRDEILTAIFILFSTWLLITGSATLRVLDFTVDDIGDEGMAIISEALQHNKSLTTLTVTQCGLSVKGTVVSVWIKMYFLT